MVILQFESLSPLGIEGFVFGERLHVLIDELNGTKRVTFTVYIGRGKSLGAYNLHLQPADVVDFMKRI